MVCIASSDSTNCPESKPMFSGPSGTTFSLAINIQGSDSLNGFDISVATNASMLSPLSIDLNDTIFPANVRFVAVDSTSSVYGVGVAHLAMVGVGFHTTAPTTGTLFRINYQIVGAPSNRTALDFELVTVTSPGTPAVVLPEATQGALFTVQPPQPDFTIIASPVTLNFPRGSTGTSTIDVSSVNSFSGRLDLSASTSDTGISAALSTSSTTLSDRSSVRITVMVSSTLYVLPGDYLVTVNATSGSVSHGVDLVVVISDFEAYGNPINLTILIGGPGDYAPPHTVPSFSTSSEIHVASILGFRGNITFSANIGSSSNHAPSVHLSSTSQFLSGRPEQEALVTLTVTAANSTPVGTYLASVTVSNGSLSHSLLLTVVISR